MAKILVVGCGSIGERHIRCLRAAGAEHIAACDPRPERLARMRQIYGVEEIFEEYESIELTDFDAVMICTPTHLHIPQAMRAAAAGCHLFIEKPLSVTMDGVDELLSRCRQRGLVVQVGYVMRHHPALKGARQIIAAGGIGRPLMVLVKVGYFIGKYRPEYPELYWARAATGGGVIFDASHQLDFVQWLVGPVEAVCCARDHFVLETDPDVEDAAVLLLRFEGGALGCASFNNLQLNYRSFLEVVGDGGTVEWDYVEACVRHFTADPPRWEATSYPELERDEIFIAQARNFLAAIEGRQPPACTGEEGRRALAVALAAQRSAAQRRWVSVDEVA